MKGIDRERINAGSSSFWTWEKGQSDPLLGG